MFQNPHGLESITDEDEEQLAELYAVSKIPKVTLFRAKHTLNVKRCLLLVTVL